MALADVLNSADVDWKTERKQALKASLNHDQQKRLNKQTQRAHRARRKRELELDWDWNLNLEHERQKERKDSKWTRKSNGQT
ncbi:hypothetical protein CPC08DRAFT_714136 [Agrocybe pediades]|nr:hypothetical protein CPC08DRAFT_714136 [Agrocybe pediades]